MSWDFAGRFYRALREAEQALDRGAAEPPWRPEYAELFGTPERLHLALLMRWRTMVQAQVDPAHADPEETMEQLRAAYPGLSRFVRTSQAPRSLAGVA